MTKRVELFHPALNEGRLRYEHLEGMEYRYGIVDCYNTMRRMFLDNLNIKLTNFARPNDFWLHGFDFYMDHFASEGFETIPTIPNGDYNPFDTFLIAIPDSRDTTKVVTNHAAVYLGQGMIIHHRLGKLSKIEPYRWTMKDSTTCIIRHKDVPNLINRKENSVDILEHLLPHKRQLILGAVNERENPNR